jgi:hypothetical protein
MIKQDTLPPPDTIRIELVTAIHMLASCFENALYAFGKDAEARKVAEGDIAHAMKTAAKYNQNGAALAAQAPQPIPRVLFDGFSVLQALDPKAKARTSGENVSDVLDAVVKMMRASVCKCKGTGWVCENHDSKPWGDSPGECKCGAGKPCLCNPGATVEWDAVIASADQSEALAAQAPQPSPLVSVGEDGEGQENHCSECGAEPGQMCSDEEGTEHGRKVHAVRQALPDGQQFCYCGDEISLQGVSGGAAPEGLYGSVTIKVGGEFVRYVRAPQQAQGVAAKITEEQHVAACKVLLRANGLDGLPQRMLDAIRAAAPQHGDKTP